MTAEAVLCSSSVRVRTELIGSVHGYPDRSERVENPHGAAVGFHYLAQALIWTGLRATCAPLTHTSRTHFTASRTRCITLAVWREVRSARGEARIHRPDVIAVRDDKISALYAFLDSMPS